MRFLYHIDPEGTIRKIYRGFDCATHADVIGDDLNILIA